MDEVEELIRRDVDNSAPPPNSERASWPFLIAMSGVAPILLLAWVGSEQPLMGLLIALGGFLFSAGAFLMNRDWEDSIAWAVFKRAGFGVHGNGPWPSTYTHEEKRSIMRLFAGIAGCQGLVILVIGLVSAFSS